MKGDLIDGLIALGLLDIEQARAAAAKSDDNLTPLARLALVGVDVGALLPAVSMLSGVPLCPPALLAGTGATVVVLSNAARIALRSLPAVPLRTAPDAPLDVVVADPAARDWVNAIISVEFRVCLAPEDKVRRLAERLLVTDMIRVADALASAPPSSSSAPAVPVSVQAGHTPVPAIAKSEESTLVERKRPQLGADAIAAAMAEQVELGDDEKKRILELEAKIDTATPAELLAVSPSAPVDVIKQRYYELSRAFHPDAHFRKNLGSFRARLNRVFRGLKAAQDALLAAAEARDRLDLASGHVRRPNVDEGSSKSKPSPRSPAPRPSDEGSSTSKPSPRSPPPPRPSDEGSSKSQPSPRSAPPRPGDEGSSKSKPSPRSPAIAGTGNTPIASQSPFAFSASSSSSSPAFVRDELPTGPTRPFPRSNTGSIPRLAAAKKRAPIAAMVGGGVVVGVLVVAVAAVAIGGGGGGAKTGGTSGGDDVAARQTKLLADARDESAKGYFADAIVSASQAIDLDPQSERAAEARVVRGAALIDGAERADGVRDLEAALRRLPADAPAHAEAEKLLERAQKGHP